MPRGASAEAPEYPNGVYRAPTAAFRAKRSAIASYRDGWRSSASRSCMNLAAAAWTRVPAARSSVVAIAMADAAAEGSASASGRLRLRVAAALFGLFWGFFFYGLIDLLAFAQGEQFHAALLLSTGWGLVFLFLTAGPLLALSARASAVSPSALAQVALVAVAVVAAAALSSSPGHLFVSAGVIATVAVLAVFARERPWDVMQTWRWSAVPGGAADPGRRTMLRLRLDVGADDRRRSTHRRHMGTRSLARPGRAAARAAADLRAGGGSSLRLAPAPLVRRHSRGVVRGRVLARAEPCSVREPPLGRNHVALVGGVRRCHLPQRAGRRAGRADEQVRA